MKKIFLITTTLILVFTLSGCFGNHLKDHTQYSRSVGDYDLYFEDLAEDVECPQVDGYLYTLYSVDGNTFKYKGIRSTNGCYVPLKANTGSGFSTVDNLLDREKITVSELENVLWTFDFTIIQTPDYEIGSIDFIEYFEQVGEYEIYVADYDGMICFDLDVVTLFEYDGVEFDVLGYSSGDGCISNYYIYYVEESEDDTTTDDDATTDDATTDDTTDDEEGEIISIYEALELGYITTSDVVQAEYESDVIEIYSTDTVLAVEGALYYVDETQVYTESNPYVLSVSEVGDVLELLAASRFRYSTDELDDEDYYISIVDSNDTEHMYLMYREYQEGSQHVIAMLILTDAVGTEFVYEIYASGIRIVSDDVDVFAENMNQTFILDLLE